jgi:hypothetical protein
MPRFSLPIAALLLVVVAGSAEGQSADDRLKLQGGWLVDSTVSEMDGTRSMTLTTLEIGEGLGSDRRSLTLRCRAGLTDAWISTRTVLESAPNAARGLTTIRYRRDGRDAKAEYWDESRTMQAALSRRPLPFIRELIQTDTLRIEFTPFRQAPVMAKFYVGDVDSLATELLKRCRAKP